MLDPVNSTIIIKSSHSNGSHINNFEITTLYNQRIKIIYLKMSTIIQNSL